jgi:hypothetical protein
MSHFTAQCRAAGRSCGACRGVRKRRPPARSTGGRTAGVPAQKWLCISFYVAAVVKPSCVCFSSRHALSAVSPDPDWSGGFLWRWDPSSPTPFSPCACTHPSPDALCVFRRGLEGLWEATPSLRRLLHEPGNPTGRLHQHPDRSLTQHRKPTSASLRTAPSGNTPVSRKRPHAMSH